jgi:sulfate transport system permease protein
VPEPAATALASTSASEAAPTLAAPARRVTTACALRVALIALVVAYLGVVLVGPIAALLVELAEAGVTEALSTLLSPDALRALGISVSLVVIAVAVNAVVGTVGAIAIVRHRFPLRSVVDALADLPLAVSPVMIGLAFLLLFGRDGLLDPLLDALDLRIVFAFPGLVIGTLFVTLPYAIREVVYLLEQLGTSEEEAAATLGASPFQVFRYVTLPNLRPALGYGLLMTVARAFGEFGAVLVLGGSISGKTQTATTFIHDAIEERMSSAAYAMAALLSLVSVVLLLALEREKRGAVRSRNATRSKRRNAAEPCTSASSTSESPSGASSPSTT